MFSVNVRDLVFQSYCCGCEQQLFTDDGAESESFKSWCTTCRARLTRHGPNSCEFCGGYYSGHNPFAGRCKLCFNTEFSFDRCIAIGNYRGLLQQLVIRMKRERDEVLAYQFSLLLAERIREGETTTPYDLVIPVPTHWWRRIQRGFHGPDILAEGVGQSRNIASVNSCLKLKRMTRKQGKLSIAGRFQNMKNAFQLNSKPEVAGKRILLVDDVMTSGATAEAAAKVLKKAGAKTVDVGVIARGVRVS